MVSFRDLETTEQALAWTNQLNEKWPERRTIIDHIVGQLQTLPQQPLTVVELCCGAGVLGQALLSRIPEMTYLGLDSSPLLVAVARQQLTSFAHQADVQVVDLNSDEWLGLLPAAVTAIVSMQSLHDLGGENEVNRIYRLARQIIVPGGLFLNADLIVPPAVERPDNPGRRSIPRHLTLLQSHQYESVICPLEIGEFGCFVGYIPEKSETKE